MIAAVILSLIVVASALPSPHIINGDVSAKGKWPYQVSIQVLRDTGKFGHTCGGTIIDRKWILTASHCIMLYEQPEDYRIKLGLFSLSKDDAEQVITPKRLIMHPDFSLASPGLPDDIALIELSVPANLTANVQLAPLPADDSDNFASNTDCWMSGWGRNDREEPTPSDLLREKKVPILTNEYCAQLYEELIDFLPVLPKHICINDPGKQDVHACHGDSGGPVSCKNKEGKFVIAGVASRTGPLNCENFPSVYIRTSKFLDWIKENMKEE